jgi:hypothetical protein
MSYLMCPIEYKATNQFSTYVKEMKVTEPPKNVPSIITLVVIKFKI